jgi:hypothetical protein
MFGREDIPSQLFSGFSLYMGALYGRGDGDEEKAVI